MASPRTVPTSGSKADRRHQRDDIITSCFLFGLAGKAPGCLLDISIGGARIRCDYDVLYFGLREQQEIMFVVPNFKLQIKGTVVRIQTIASGYDIGVRFDEPDKAIAGKILTYKLKTIR